MIECFVMHDTGGFYVCSLFVSKECVNNKSVLPLVKYGKCAANDVKGCD